MVLTKNNRIDHELGNHPLLDLLKTMYVYQQKHFNKLVNIPVTESMLFGLASGPGFLFKTNQFRNQAIGTSSLDFLQDLATSTGTWINRRFSMGEKEMISEMEEYLAVWKAPVLVTVPLSLFSNMTDVRKSEENFISDENVDEQLVTKCLVTMINHEVVECLVHSERDPIYVDKLEFQHTLTGLSNRWVDIIFPSNDISTEWMYEFSIKRYIHRFKTGWKTFGNVPENMHRFFQVYMNQPYLDNWEDTFVYSENLGGDFGRGWYASFLKTASKERQSHVLEKAANMYTTISGLWCEWFETMKLEIVDQELMQTIFSLENEAVRLLASRYDKEVVIDDYGYPKPIL